jgi:hypothetical protein
MRALTPFLAPIAALLFTATSVVIAQERLPWERPDAYSSPSYPPAGPGDGYPSSRPNDAYSPARPPADAYRPNEGYRTAEPARPAPYNEPYRPPSPPPGGGERYEYGYDRYGDQGPRGGGGYNSDAPPRSGPEPYDRNYGDRGYYDRGPPPGEPPYDGPPRYADRGPAPYSRNEILDAGHSFFGSVTQGLAGAIEYVFQQAGRPNGYILGEDAGGAFVAGLRYGEGVLHTKDAGRHKVYWQGPSLGYDFGGEGSKTMVLVYNLRDISEIYNRFGGVQGSAYVVGGVSVQFQKYGDVVLAPIRAGVGLRLGANVGYLKYTRTPTWNPF